MGDSEYTYGVVVFPYCKYFLECFNHKFGKNGICKNAEKCKEKELFHFKGIFTREDLKAYDGPLWLIADTTDYSFEFLQFCLNRCNDIKRKKYIRNIIRRKKALQIKNYFKTIVNKNGYS
jgi:hypothetical protein